MRQKFIPDKIFWCTSCESSLAIYLQALHAANVGNTGFVIIRDGPIFKKSTPSFHEFGFPLQIVKGDDPSEIIEVCDLPCNILSVLPNMLNNWKLYSFSFYYSHEFW